jgi:GT2 family glycosyltransferase
MITIIYSTKQNEDFILKKNEEFYKSCKVVNVQILGYTNKGEYSLSEIYNKGIESAINDIIVCAHDDVALEDSWGEKLIEDFNKNKDFAIIGKAGFCNFPKSAICWENLQISMIGEVFHRYDDYSEKPSIYSANMPILQRCVSVDGCFIAFDKTKIKHKFDTSLKGFHFYDHAFCLSNFVEGVKIGVTSSFKLLHFSRGNPNEEFYRIKDDFLKKWSSVLPLEIKPNEIYFSNETSIKNKEKVAIIVPTKDKIDLLFGCINSFLSKCSNFDLYIADTGSSEENIEKINKFICGRYNIKLIQYDYYNFAKINNDVFEKYVFGKYEYVLFSNNDIFVMNDVISLMVETHNKFENVGTVGARLHFKDNTIQHEGMYAFRVDNYFRISHIGLYSYYPKNIEEKGVLGNTAALMMMKSNTFKELGMFNEQYNNCFEDVELNLNCIVNKKSNYINGMATAYHYESQTRKDNPKDIEKLMEDYVNTLVPFVNKNINKLKQFILNHNVAFSKN